MDNIKNQEKAKNITPLKILDDSKTGGSNQINMQTVFMRGKAITKVKGQEPRLYEALRVIAGPFFKFTIVKIKEPNKNP